MSAEDHWCNLYRYSSSEKNIIIISCYNIYCHAGVRIRIRSIFGKWNRIILWPKSWIRNLSGSSLNLCGSATQGTKKLTFFWLNWILSALLRIGMFFPDPTFFHPGSDFFPSRITLFSIPDSVSELFSSVADPWHFGVDSDLRIHASD